MDEKTDQFIQQLASTAAANAFILEFLLRAELSRLQKPQRLQIAKYLLDASLKTEPFHGSAKDDFQAARLADLLIDMQAKIDQMIGRALRATADAEGGS